MINGISNGILSIRAYNCIYNQYPRKRFLHLIKIEKRNCKGWSSFIKILKLHNAGDQRTFEEAKGLVINDYQNILEEKWIAELKKKYPVKVDEKVFQSLLK